MATIRVLVVDDDENKALDYARAVLRRVGGINSPIQGEVAIALSPAEARDRLHAAQRQQNDFDILVTDLYMNGEDGLDLIRSLPALGLRPESLDVVLVSRKSDAASLRTAIDEAAVYWGGHKDAIRRALTDDEDIESLLETVTSVVSARLEERRSSYYRVTAPDPETTITGRFVTADPALTKQLDLLYNTFAPSELSILIQGENGTGKERLAEEIHARSKSRSTCPPWPIL